MENATDLLTNKIIPLIFSHIKEDLYLRDNDYINPYKVLDYLRSIKFACKAPGSKTFGGTLKMIKYVLDIMTEEDCIAFLSNLPYLYCGFDFGVETKKILYGKIYDKSVINMSMIFYSESPDIINERIDQLQSEEDFDDFYGCFEHYFNDVCKNNDTVVCVIEHICNTIFSHTSHLLSAYMLIKFYYYYPNQNIKDALIVKPDLSYYVQRAYSKTNPSSHNESLWDLMDAYEQSYNCVIDGYDFQFSVHLLMNGEKNEVLKRGHLLVKEYAHTGRDLKNEISSTEEKSDHGLDNICMYAERLGHGLSEHDISLLKNFMTEQINNP